MIRHKYWWPGMNIEIEDAVKRCFECQISTETKHTEPAKMTELPSRPWSTVEVDFCGPFPNGSYALVMIDQYSRYPEVEFTTTTSFEATRTKLKKIFATRGVPKTLQSDNGPPFNSHAFSDFARESGFQHKRITPRHPKAQGQVEGFNKLVNKIMTIGHRYDREVRTKMDHFPTEMHQNDREVRENDSRYKNKCKQYHDNRYKTKRHTLKVMPF